MRRLPVIAMGLMVLACAASSAGSPPADPVVPVAAAPAFTPGAGTYASAQTVAISSTTPGAVVRCTLDGSAPSAASPSCAGPIAVSTTTTIRAIATAAGYTDSPAASATYTIAGGLPTAAAPTFSPGEGTYASPQTVTISSTTPGAIVRCTLDGSVPDATSPDCAAPIAVSTTTTIRAIATAAGYADSPAASATYTIAVQDPTLLQKIQALSTKRQLLGHQSVGAILMYGTNGTGGLDAILQSYPTGGVRLVSNPSSISEIPVGGWAEYELGTNGDPIGKVDQFDSLVRTTFEGRLDYAAMKFCFADFGESTDVAPIWARYQTVMDALEVSFPGQIIYWTVPLLPWVEGGANLKREEMSEHIRARYGATGRVFDLALEERTGADGVLVTRDDPTTPGVEAIPAMAYEWCMDYGGGVASDGHPNDTFATAVATDYIDFMYQVLVR